MNRDTLRGEWMQVKGKLRERWGKLTDDDVEQVAGSAEQLLGRLQTRYGYARERAEEELDAFLEARVEIGTKKKEAVR